MSDFVHEFHCVSHCRAACGPKLIISPRAIVLWRVICFDEHTALRWTGLLEAALFIGARRDCLSSAGLHLTLLEFCQSFMISLSLILCNQRAIKVSQIWGRQVTYSFAEPLKILVRLFFGVNAGHGVGGIAFVGSRGVLISSPGVMSLQTNAHGLIFCCLRTKEKLNFGRFWVVFKVDTVHLRSFF